MFFVLTFVSYSNLVRDWNQAALLSLGGDENSIWLFVFCASTCKINCSGFYLI